MIIALLIGVSYNNTPYFLEGCIPDVERLSGYLRASGVTDITILRDDVHGVGDVLYPSRTNVLKAFANVLRKAKASDSVYVHFSGHGFYVENAGSLAGGGHAISDETHECLLMHSNSTPSIGSIGATNTICEGQMTQMFTFLPPGVPLLMTVDACAAGAMFDLPFNMQVKAGSANGEAHFSMRPSGGKNSAGKQANIIIFTAVRENKYSWDVKVDGKTYGIFTKTFIDLLEASRAQKKYMSCIDMLWNLDKHLRIRKNAQDPQLSLVSRDDANNYIFI
jgi:hypothetical protein